MFYIFSCVLSLHELQSFLLRLMLFSLLQYDAGSIAFMVLHFGSDVSNRPLDGGGRVILEEFIHLEQQLTIPKMINSECCFAMEMSIFKGRKPKDAQHISVRFS